MHGGRRCSLRLVGYLGPPPSVCHISDGFNLNDQPKFRAGGIAAGKRRPGRAGRERAAVDFDEKTSGIDRGISSLTAAVDGTEAIEAIVARMKSLAVPAKSTTASIIAEPVSRFNDLRTRIANLLALKTRQQLGIQALAFAGRAEQGILAIFR